MRVTILLVFLVACGAAQAAKLPPLLIYEENANGDARRISDYEIVDTPQFLFTGTGIDRSSIEVYCSPSAAPVILRFATLLFYVNSDRAHEGIYDGEKVAILPMTDPASPLKGRPDNAKRIVDRANRQCGRSPSNSPETAATSRHGFDAATVICSLVDAGAFASEPCEVSGWESTIKITADVRGPIAKKMCDDVVTAAHNMNLSFNREWKIEIYSPFSGDNTVAFCNP